LHGEPINKCIRAKFPKRELDGKTRKDMRKNKMFDSDFAIEFEFEIVDVGKKMKARQHEDIQPKHFGNIRHVSVIKQVQSGQDTSDDTDSDYGDADEA
jgi:hypothetical protein